MRTIHADSLAQLSASPVRPRLFCELETATGYLRLWTGLADVTWAGKVWQRGDFLLGWSSVTEELGGQPAGLTITLTGQTQELLTDALEEFCQNSSGIVYLGFVDSSDSVIANPFVLFVGRLDTIGITDTVDKSEIALDYENRLIDSRRGTPFTYNHETQQILYPGQGDLGFEYVQQLKEWKEFWGKQK